MSFYDYSKDLFLGELIKQAGLEETLSGIAEKVKGKMPASREQVSRTHGGLIGGALGAMLGGSLKAKGVHATGALLGGGTGVALGHLWPEIKEKLKKKGIRIRE